MKKFVSHMVLLLNKEQKVQGSDTTVLNRNSKAHNIINKVNLQ